MTHTTGPFPTLTRFLGTRTFLRISRCAPSGSAIVLETHHSLFRQVEILWVWFQRHVLFFVAITWIQGSVRLGLVTSSDVLLVMNGL